MKRITCGLLCLVLALASLTSLAASPSISLGGRNAQVEITLSGGVITLENLPDEDNFEYLIFFLQSGGSDAQINRVTVRRGADKSAVYDISSVKDGVYYLQIYSSSAEYGTYWSYVYGNCIAIDKGKMEFVLPSVYEHNLQVFSGKRTDLSVLEYYLKPSHGIQSDDSKVISLARTLTGGLKTDREKVRAIHDWVCRSVYYDYDVYYGASPRGDMTAAGTLTRRTAVCQGYASLTAALLRAAGIPAKLIEGYALSGGGDWSGEPDGGSFNANHAWNEAFVDGRWIILDTTWDSRNRYENGEHSSVQAARHLYFDPSLEFFSATHRIDDYTEGHIPGFTVKPTSAAVVVNGVKMQFESYNIKGNNYFKLRDLAYVLRGTSKQFDVEWDGAKMAINLVSGRPYTVAGGEMTLGDGTEKPAKGSTDSVFKNGNPVGITAYKIGENNFYKLRDVMSLFDIGVIWDEQSATISIDTSIGYTAE